MLLSLDEQTRKDKKKEQDDDGIHFITVVTSCYTPITRRTEEKRPDKRTG